MTTRYQFGGDASDFTYAAQAFGALTLLVLSPNTVTNFYSAPSGGTHYTDLLDANSNPVTFVTTDGFGQLPVFSGPAGVTMLWADAGAGMRVMIRPTGSSSSLDTDTAANVGNPASATAIALAGMYAPLNTYLTAAATVSAAFTSALGLPLQVYDNFKRTDRDLSHDVCPSTTLGYSLQPELSATLTTMNIVSGVARRYPAGTADSPILMAPVRSPIVAMGAEYAFPAGGTTVPTGAIIGTCAVSFGAGSIQLAVHPTGWQLFSYNGSSTVLQSGTFGTPLVADGVTRYRSLAWYDAASSTLTMSIPAGDGTTNQQTIVLTDARVATNWGGNFVCIQHNVNLTTDTDAIFFQMAGA